MKTTMSSTQMFYIDGQWTTPISTAKRDIVNPATEEMIAAISIGGKEDVDAAVAAAKAAFPSWSKTSQTERIGVLESILAIYRRRIRDVERAITSEMGAPATLARNLQANAGVVHLEETLKVLRDYAFEQIDGSTAILREPIGVCALITPWNWPMNQVVCKLAPALAAGCTVVLKPSEIAPLSAIILAEILHEAKVPRGVFNLVNGTGEGVGTHLSTHPDVDMVSFTGSNRAGIAVSKAAADTVKRVTLELGGKSATIILSDADLPLSAKHALHACFLNSGQSCVAASRVLVQKNQVNEFADCLLHAAKAWQVGDPTNESTALGPLTGEAQFLRVQAYIQQGMDQGARLLQGGVGRPKEMSRGYFTKPTIFRDVTPEMTIAREEIFGPVLCIIAYEDERDAIRIANDSIFGLGGCVHSADPRRASKVASQIRAGIMLINGALYDHAAPFGGYKQSGNGREWGRFGLEEYLEVKAIAGYVAA